MIKNIFISFLFLSTFSYSCTEKAPCTQGFQLLYLIRLNFNVKKNICLTSKEQLKEVSEEMRSLECNSFVNESLKFLYAHYLCSQYNIEHGFRQNYSIDDNHEKEIIINNDTKNDLSTQNYIKGLDLLGERCLSFRSDVDYFFKFLEHLKRLNIENQSIGKLINSLEEKIAIIENNYKIDFSNFSTIENKKTLKEVNRCVCIFNNICNLILSINCINIIDGFFKCQLNPISHDYLIQRTCIIEILKKLKEKNEEFSDYMNYLYSFTLENKSFAGTGLRRTIHSYESYNYLLSCLKNDFNFKNKYLEYLFYSKMADTCRFLKKFEESTFYYQGALECNFGMKDVYGLSKAYFKLGKYEKALNVFKKAREYPSLNDSDQKILNYRIKYYLRLLEKTGKEEEYQAILFENNKTVIENRLLKNKKWGSLIKKYLDLKAQKNANFEEKNTPHLILSKASNQLKKDVFYSYETTLSTSENYKKYYKNAPLSKIKTRNTAGLEFTASENPHTLPIIKPFVRIEEVIKNNPYNIFCELFSCYENPSKRDETLKISLENIEILMKALGFKFDRSKGKGSHKKITLAKSNKSEEQVFIIPNDPYLKPHYITSLRKIFIGMGFYPESLEPILISKGLL